MNHSEIVSFIWSVADLIRDTFKRGKYQDVILPMTVLRRLDCVLAPTKPEVLRRYEELKGRPEAMAGQLRRASGFDFYNVSPYDFERLVADPPNLAGNLRSYIARFSSNMREVLEAFRFGNTISMLNEGRLLFSVVQRFKDVDLHPDKIDNPTMGTIFEELIRKFNGGTQREPGRTLYAARRGSPDGRPDARWRRRSHRPDRCGPRHLRSVLRFRRHADDRQGAHHGRSARERPGDPPGD